ncbi:MAG: hypothetical protein ACRYHQ_01755 [Janthinobacterium lividum]
MAKPPAATLSVLTDLRPVDDTAPAIRHAIARAMGKHAAAHAHRSELAASIPRLTLELDDDAALDQVEAEVRSTDRDLVRIDALLVELHARLVPAQHEEKLQRLAVQAQAANEESAACRAWLAEAVPAMAQQLLEGARIRLSAKITHQSYDLALRASGLPVEMAATLPDVVPPISAMKSDRITLSAEQTIAATLFAVLRDAERLVALG